MPILHAQRSYRPVPCQCYYSHLLALYLSPAVLYHPYPSKHRPTNNKQPLLLLPNPLHHPTCPLQQRAPGAIRARYAVELELWRCPGERDGGPRDAVQDFGVGCARVRGGVEGLVEGEEAGGGVSCCWYLVLG